MAVTLYREQILTEDDLNIYVLDQDGNYYDPYRIVYTIYRRILGCLTKQMASFQVDEEPILETIDSIPVKFGIGQYFAAWTMPQDIEVGNYRIKWTIQKYSDSQEIQEIEEFAIVYRVSQDLIARYSGDSDKVILPHERFCGPSAG